MHRQMIHLGYEFHGQWNGRTHYTREPPAVHTAEEIAEELRIDPARVVVMEHPSAWGQQVFVHIQDLPK